MSKKDKKLERMKNNPRDWKIDDLKTIAHEFEFEVRNSRTGSHVIFYHPNYPDNLTVPAKKPIKPIYVKQLIAFIERLKS